MIAIDTNILVYAHRLDSPWNAVAFERLRTLSSSGSSWGIPWPCVHEFIGIVTHPRIYKPPTALERALAQVDAWLEAPTAVVLGESEGHWAKLRALLLASRSLGPKVHDARIAAICIAHGVHELWSADRDFSAFPSLRVRNPLISP